tara:strand:+ start:6105 stop:6287 length:183 start_codon:yes stop_codon:yes gene_type:complete
MFALIKILAELEEMAIKGNQNKMVIKLAEAQAWANGYYEATRQPRVKTANKRIKEIGEEE